MPSKYDAINKLKAKNPELTWTQAANQAGFEGEWTSYKGKAKPRTGDVRGQTRRRTAFDQPSTEMAGYEAKQLKRQSTEVSARAEMFGLEPSQIEHLADQVDVEGLTAGAPGDPTNLMQVRQSEARYKDVVKLAVGKENAVTINPAEESLRVIPRKFFDPLADPATLPGVDIPIGTKVEEVQRLTARFKGGKALLGVLPLGTAATAAFTVSDIAQAAQGVSSVQQATSTPEAVAGGLEAVSGALGVAATKFPVLAAPAAVFSTTGGAMRLRMQRDIERERTQQVMAGEVSRYGPAVTETPTLTKPESNYKRRRRARTGRS
jgi:hypothetical protein